MERHRIDKAALRETITSLEGLTNEQKAELLQLLSEQKPYGLVWEGHTEDVEEQLRTQLPVLSEVKDKLIISPPSEGAGEVPNHVLIEGDNLHALTALTYTHEGKVDVIYIDPPYNTGNKDFVYNDSIVDSEDGYRHSKWLSFMHKRLKIAKRLLSDRGVIFISIDDNEQANLKLLCDEVFGSENLVGNVIWEKADSPRMDVTGFSVRHDYILVYKMRDFELRRLPVEEIPEHYNRTDEKGRRYYTKPMKIMGGHTSDSLFYPLIAPDGTEVYPYDKNGNKSGWRWSKKKVEEERERLDWVNGKNGWNPYFRIYADNMKDMPVETIWKFEQVGSNRTAKNALNDILGDKAFSYPKPTTLIKHILKIAGADNITLLDFFAGSGTTLHATMQLNAEDGGHRQCILVTNNENGICENVTYERNRRVIQGYTTPKGVEVPGLSGNNLRYYRTDFVERENTHQNRKRLMGASVDLVCLREGIYHEEERLAGRRINTRIMRYFTEGERQLLFVFEPAVIPQLAQLLPQVATPQCPLRLYVFSDGAYAYEDELRAVADRIEVCALPNAIRQAYKSALPRPIEKELESVNLEETVEP